MTRAGPFPMLILLIMTQNCCRTNPAFWLVQTIFEALWLADPKTSLLTGKTQKITKTFKMLRHGEQTKSRFTSAKQHKEVQHYFDFENIHCDIKWFWLSSMFESTLKCYFLMDVDNFVSTRVSLTKFVQMKVKVWNL